MTTIEQTYELLKDIEAKLATLPQGSRFPPSAINLTVLSDFVGNLGLVSAGEFRCGNGIEPGYGFDGMRIAYPPLTYGGSTWNLVGVDNDVLQVGISATDGKLYMGGGKVIGDTEGLTFNLDGLAGTDYQNYIKFLVGGVRVAQLYAFHDPAIDTIIGVSAHNEGQPNRAFVNSVSEATYRARTWIAAHSGTVHEQILIDADSDGNSAIIIGDQGHFGTRFGTDASYPASNDVYITNDLRVGGGLHVGSLGTDPGADNIVADGTITATGEFVGAINNALLTEQGDIIYASAASTPAALAHGTAGQVLKTGGNAANPSWATLGIADISDLLTSALAFTNQISVTSSVAPPLKSIITSSTASGNYVGLNLLHHNSVAVTDGCGVGISFNIQDDADTENLIGNISCRRTGADDTGQFYFYTYYTGGNAVLALKILPTSSTAVTFTPLDASTWALGTTIGTKFGSATNQKLAFYNAAPVVQQAHIADPSGGAVVDTQCRSAVNSILAWLTTMGFTA